MAIIGTLPNVIANGQALDATPVMADFNWILSQVNSNAAQLAGANTFTGLQSGIAASVAAAFPTASQVQNAAFNWCGTAAGTANALTLTPAVAAASYSAGQMFWFKSGAAVNTAATTVAVSGLTALTVQVSGVATTGGEIQPNSWYMFLIDASGASAQLLKVSAGGAAAGANSDITSLNGLTSAIYATGQCRMLLNGSNVVLMPRGGNTITVAGRSCIIPDAGVSLAPTSLLAATLYYIYAVPTAGVITSLVASTTTHSTDTTAGNKGVEIMSGNSAYSLVGMAYVKTAATFADTASQRFVSSWFNRKPIVGLTPYTASVSVSGASYVEMAPAYRLEFLAWLGDAVTLSFVGPLSVNSASGYINASFGIDSATVAEDVMDTLQNSTSANSGTSPALVFNKFGLTEGYHFATLLVNNAGAGNAITCVGSATPGTRGVISGIYQG